MKKSTELKKELIEALCEDVKDLIEDKPLKDTSNIMWVDYLHGKGIIQHIFTGAYVTPKGRVLLVEHKDSEAAVNLFLDEIKSVDTIERILNGFKLG